MYYTTQNLGRKNKSIEDFEGISGSSKGWTVALKALEMKNASAY